MIIPKPNFYKKNGTVEIKAQLCSEKELVFCEKAFKRVFKKLFDISVTSGEEGIFLRYDSSLAKNEYKIKGRTVYASTVEGGSYGLATMFQLLQKENDAIILADVEILDKPDKEFRLFCSDVARKWHDYSILLSYVDICYLNKMKYLNLKFMDDESFTLPLKCFPKAATKGLSYTRAEIDFLVEYAHEANVEVIPDVNLLGHTTELIKNCPEDFGNNFDKAFVGDSYSHNLTCIGKKNIFNNIRKVYEEVAEIFKYSPYFSIGCDEAEHDKWNYCKDCREYMKRNHITSTKELNAHYIAKMIDICISVGKTPIVSESFGPEYADMIPRDIVVGSWENYYNTAPSLLAAGFRIYNMSWKPTYIVPQRNFKGIDISWSVTGNDHNLYKWQHWWEKSEAYPNDIIIEPNDAVIGGALSQFECTYEEEHDRVVLNLPMIADRTWNEFEYYSHEEMMHVNKKIIQMEEKLY